MCGNSIRGRQKALFCYFLFFSGALIVAGSGVVGWGRKSYLGPAETASFSSRDFSRSMTHFDKLYWQDISTFYFYEPLLFQISVTTITFTVNSHANNHDYKYIYLFQILYSIKSVLLLKYTLRFSTSLFIFKSYLNVKQRSYFF